MIIVIEDSKILSFLTSFLISAAISTSYICNDNPVNLVIRNNINGDFSIIKDLSSIEIGAFVTLDWNKKKLMLPYSPIKKSLSFSDKKWDWRYEYDKEGKINEKEPKLYELLPSGKYVEYACQIKTEEIS
tara:strand:- start:797 stop:1186 length:390 start_codon:yes stop_codon:yes gene_type:complete